MFGAATTDLVTILNAGTAMSASYQLLSVDIIKEVNKLPKAQIVLADGDATIPQFEVSDAGFFNPGEKIEIQLVGETVFQGIVVRHRVKSDLQRNSKLLIDLADAAIKLTTQRKNAVFVDSTDSDIIKDILTQAGGLTVGTIAATKPQHPEMVQFYSTDWDFILSRAEANGLWILVDDGSITAVLPKLSGSPAYSFEYGVSPMYSFEMEADIRSQHKAVQSTAWDSATQAMAAPVSATDLSLSQGDLKPADLAVAIGAPQYDLIVGGELAEGEAKAWADAKLSKSRLSMMRGRIKTLGMTEAKPGDLMEVTGIGKHFNGMTLVTAVRHQVSPQQGWQTDVQFGLSATWFSQNADIVDTPAAGLLPAVHGLQIGIVDEFVEDPDKKLRVRVKVPTLSGETDGLVWARLAALDAGLSADGQGRGTFFRPEPGDEVVLGFLNADPRQPIILGALYSSTNLSPWEVTADNFEKGIVSKQNLKFSFNDEDKSITLETPEANKISIFDDGTIEMIDSNENQIVMDAMGIFISSKKDITVKAEGNLTLESGKNVTIKGSQIDVN